MAIVVKIQKLVVPLGYYSDRILDEGYDNQKAANGRKVSAHHHLVSNNILACGNRRSRPDPTYGLTGSLSESRRSSILLVCCLMASRGLDSVESSLTGPPKGLEAPMP